MVAALALPAPAAAAPPPGFYGVVTQDGGAPEEGDLGTIRAGGAGSIRLLAHWAAIEAQEGAYDWSSLDAAVRSAVGAGLKPMLFLWGTPAWAVNRDGYACAVNCNVFAPASRETREAFARFAAAAVGRYGPGGDFWEAPEIACPLPVPILCPDGPEPPCRCDQPAPLRVWQVWNEENSRTYYAPVVNVAGYADLLKRASRAIRSADPGAEVVLGGMWGPNSPGADSDGRRVATPVSLFLKRLYRVKGIKKAFDSIALHPYAANLGGVRRQVKAARRIVKRSGDRKASTWITEIGWASDGPPQNPYVKGLDGQARLLTRSLSMLQKRRRAYRVRGVFWYAWRDKPGGSSICDWCGHAGLRDDDGSAKPSWDAFVRVAR
ncbi:MAG: hypothetical protein ACRDKX_08745 [Solirubrobacterales bacterium]